MQIIVNADKDELFLSNTVNLTQELLKTILTCISALPDPTLVSEPHRNKFISSLTGDISNFVEVTTLLSKIIMNKNKDMLDKVKQSHFHLLFIMKAISQAQQKQDLVALEDLIKYELKDNLTQWKIDLIPQTKRMLQS